MVHCGGAAEAPLCDCLPVCLMWRRRLHEHADHVKGIRSFPGIGCFLTISVGELLSQGGLVSVCPPAQGSVAIPHGARTKCNAYSRGSMSIVVKEGRALT